jgi:hypothetical protein
MMANDTRNTPADVLSGRMGADAWPGRMPDVDRTGVAGVDFTNSLGSITAYCGSDDMLAMKPNDAYNRAEETANTNDMNTELLVYDTDVPGRTPGK